MKRRLAELAPKTWFRAAVAVALVLGHLVAFTIAGHQRLNLPFNSSPDEAPYYSNPKEDSLGPWPRQPHHWSRLIVSRWDSQHYIGFAVRGLSSCPKDGTPYQFEACGLPWMPTLGLLARGIVETTGAAPDYTLFVFSLIAALAINLLWTCKTLVKRLGLWQAWAALIAFNLYAAAFFVVTPYTEGCVFACMLGAYVCIANGQWLRASALIGAATAVRPTAMGFAVGFACAALVAARQARKTGTPRWWLPIAAIPLAAWGQLVMMVVLAVAVGDSQAYVHAQLAFTEQLGGLHFQRFFEASWYLHMFSAQHYDGVILLGALVVILLTVRELAAKLPAVEMTFLEVASVVMALVPLATVHGYWGFNRYLMLCPLIFFSAGELAARRRSIYVLWLVVCVLIYWNVELCSYISHGNPHVCPCEGQMQFSMPFQS